MKFDIDEFYKKLWLFSKIGLDRTTIKNILNEP
jgi:hypothetical protein